MSFLIFVVLIWAGVGQIIAPPCPLNPIHLQCVGAGEDCHADLRTLKRANSNVPNSCPAGGNCKVCGDDSLVCSATGVCIRRFAGVNWSCNSDRDCLSHLKCFAGQCGDPTANWSPPGYFAQNGEACNPANGNGDCLQSSGLVCNALTNKCDLSSADSSNVQCNNRDPCPPWQFCSVTNNFGGPTIQSRCKPAIPLGSRAGALCTGGSGECGWTFQCTSLNPSETTGQFARTICLEYYSLPSGRQCSSDIFCQSGRCIGGWCVEPDYSTLGDGCNIDAECGDGTWTECSCPAQGGSRSRCSKNTNSIQADFSRDEYHRQKPYLQCLEDNGCQRVNPILGSCAWNKCRQHLSGMTLIDTGSDIQSRSDVAIITLEYNLGIWPKTPTCDDFMTEGSPDYKGWEEIESGASIAQVSVATFAAVVIALLAL